MGNSTCWGGRSRECPGFPSPHHGDAHASAGTPMGSPAGAQLPDGGRGRPEGPGPRPPAINKEATSTPRCDCGSWELALPHPQRPAVRSPLLGSRWGAWASAPTGRSQGGAPLPASQSCVGEKQLNRSNKMQP